MEEIKTDLIEIRCPLKRTSNKYGRPQIYVCNKLCVRVSVGSAGTVHCGKCDREFEFDTQSSTMESIK